MVSPKEQEITLGGTWQSGNGWRIGGLWTLATEEASRFEGIVDAVDSSQAKCWAVLRWSQTDMWSDSFVWPQDKVTAIPAIPATTQRLT